MAKIHIPARPKEILVNEGKHAVRITGIREAHDGVVDVTYAVEAPDSQAGAQVKQRYNLEADAGVWAIHALLDAIGVQDAPGGFDDDECMGKRLIINVAHKQGRSNGRVFANVVRHERIEPVDRQSDLPA